MGKEHVRAKLQLAEAFASMVERMPAERITVSMVTDAIGKHRKTFYYHFSSKEQLVIWLFRYDLACALEERFPPEKLVFEPPVADSICGEFPFYARNVQKSGRIYNTPFFSMLATVLEKRRAYYRSIFANRGPGTLDYYLHQLYPPVIREDVEMLLERELEGVSPLMREHVREVFYRNDGIGFLAEFYTDAFLARFVERLTYSSSRRAARDIIPFENVVHDSLSALIKQEVANVMTRKDG